MQLRGHYEHGKLKNVIERRDTELVSLVSCRMTLTFH